MGARPGPTPAFVRGRRELLRVCLLALLVVFVPPAKASDAGADRGGESTRSQTYYRYVDDDGVLHVTNTPKSRGEWKVWRRLGGNHSAEALKGERSQKRRTRNPRRAHLYDRYIRDAAKRYQLPESLVRAVIETESNFNPSAVSSVGAMGLMQLMPATAQYLGVKNAFDPRENIFGGCKYLRLLANRFRGDMVLVLAGYNAGAGAVRKYGGVPPYAQTRAYLKAVLRRYYANERENRLGVAATKLGPARNIAE